MFSNGRGQAGVKQHLAYSAGYRAGFRGERPEPRGHQPEQFRHGYQEGRGDRPVAEERPVYRGRNMAERLAA